MILVTRLDGSTIRVNCDLLLVVEETPDTVLTFTSGLLLLVKESAEEIDQLVLAYRRRILQGVPIAVHANDEEPDGPRPVTDPAGQRP